MYHRKNIKIFGVGVTVPDLYPILKYLEHSQATQKTSSHLQSVPEESSPPNTTCHCGPLEPCLPSKPHLPSGPSEPCPPSEPHPLSEPHLQPLVPVPIPVISIEGSQGPSHDQEVRPEAKSHDEVVTVEIGEECDDTSCANRVVEIDEIENEVKKLAIKCKQRCRLLSCDHPGSPRSSVGSPPGKWSAPLVDAAVPSGDGSQLETRLNSFEGRLRTLTRDR